MPSNADGRLCTSNSLSSKFSDLKVIAGGGSGIVYSGIDSSLTSGKDDKVALKKLCLSGKGHCRVALRELRFVKRFQHENIVRTLKIVDENGVAIDGASTETSKDLRSVFVVEELLDSDLHSILENCGKLTVNTTKLFAYQLLRGLKYIHSANVVHRDIKPGNLFLRGSDLTLKIGDFGLSRVLDSRYCHRGYLTAVVSTRYYRAPEVMLDLGNYSFAIDVWSAGCVLAEMLLGRVLFCGENDLDQLNVIASAFGVTIDELKRGVDGQVPDSFSHVTSYEAVDLLKKMLIVDPGKRISVEDALRHSFFSDLHDPNDEPVCDRPFFIEHEVDNLPLKVLKRKILRSSCLEEVSKSACHRSDDALFKDFDEIFLPDGKSNCCHLNSQGDETDLSDALSSRGKSCLCSSSEEHARFDSFMPSLQDIISDLPCLDPGIASNLIDVGVAASMSEPCLNSSSTCNADDSFFSTLSPVIDTVGDSFLMQAQTFLKIHGPTASSCIDPCGGSISSPTWTPFKSALKSMNDEILKRLTDGMATGNVPRTQIRNNKMLMSQLRDQYPLLHLESLRFWI